MLVANTRKLRLIYAEGNKSDRLDAENLACLARLDPRLLAPIATGASNPGPSWRSCEALIATRTKLVNQGKSYGSPTM